VFLREITIKNYMVHQDTTIALHPLTVFVGPNGGGKSAVFDALLNYSMVSRGNLGQAFGPFPYSFRSTRYHGASNVSKIGFRVVMSESSDDAESLEYELDYSQSGMSDDRPIFTIARECLVKQPGGAVVFDRHDPDASPISRMVSL